MQNLFFHKILTKIHNVQQPWQTNEGLSKQLGLFFQFLKNKFPCQKVLDKRF